MSSPASAPPIFMTYVVLISSILLSDMSSLTAAQSAGTTVPNPPAIYPFRQTISKRMAVVLIVLVCFFIILAVLSVYTRQCTEQRYGGRLIRSTTQTPTNPQSRRTARGLDASVISTFPTFIYSNVKSHKIGTESLECVVCLSEFENESTLRLLPKCSHVFHSDCIDAWLTSHSTCPVCRASLVPKPGDMSFADLLNSDSRINGPDESQVVVRIPEGNQNLTNPNQGLIQTGSIRSRLSGLFQRSHSTGDLSDYERFTLRLPEEVRIELLNSNLNRARSCVVLPRLQSSRQGYRKNGFSGNWSRSGRRLLPVLPLLRREGSNVNGDGGGRPFARLRADGDEDGQSQL